VSSETPRARETAASRPSFEKVRPRFKVADEVIEQIRQAILSGEYHQNERLGLESLAEELGVSVMPVREALMALSKEGLVQAIPRKGFRATPLDAQDVLDVFSLHAYLASILAGRAAQVITDEQIAELREIHESISNLASAPMTAGSARKLEELNNEFHRYINRIPAGSRIRWFIRFTAGLLRTDSYGTIPGWEEATLTDHPQIIAALAAHDAERARALMEAHFLKGGILTPEDEHSRQSQDDEGLFDPEAPVVPRDHLATRPQLQDDALS
jgi:DNA-binding GntR family transcriptional regulator